MPASSRKLLIGETGMFVASLGARPGAVFDDWDQKKELL